MNCSGAQRKKLSTQIVKDSLFLSKDQFGNYIVQNIIQMNDFDQNQEMLKIFTPHLIVLCSQKFSSNVIEKVCVNLVNFSALKTSMISRETCSTNNLRDTM